MRTLIIGLLVATVGVVAHAAQEQAKADPAPPTPAAAAPALTDVDQLRLDNRDLKRQLIDMASEVARWQGAFGSCAASKGSAERMQNEAALSVEDREIVKAIEAAHPGFAFDLKTRAFSRR